MRRAYLLILFGFLLLLPVALPSCSPPLKMWPDAPGKKVLVTFPPLYAFTQAIAGSDANVQTMLTTQGPHDYDGSANDLLMVAEADLFIYNGLSLDDEFVSRMLRNHKNKSLQTLNVGETLKERKLIRIGKPIEHDGHTHGPEDPHIWLGPVQAIEMAKIITEKLSEVDPEHKKAYEKRRDELIVKLQKLHEDGKAALKDKKSRSIVTMHDSLGYFADETYGFGLTTHAIQVKPGMDPDAASLASLVEKCKKEGVALIAKEPQYSDAQALALQRSLKSRGIDIPIVTLDPLETTEAAPGTRNPDPEYYFKRMRENIDTLARTLR